MKRFEGKNVLVTGGTSGIGLATARAFAGEGARVAIAGRDETKLEAARLLLGGESLAVKADVSEEGDCCELVQRVRSRWGALHVLVNNAGIVRRDRALCEVESGDWDRHLAVNLKSVFLVCKHAIPLLVASGGGSIVNLGSQLSFVAAPNYPAYCAAKAGVVGLTRSMALDYASQGIRANCVCPGVTETPMAYVQRENFSAMTADLKKMHPLGRLGRPEDTADAILFFASAESSWITGQTLVVDGGYTLR